jgi:creatinine amidohydrolase
MRNQKLEELTAAELAEALAETSVAYVPIGSMEFHGPHLPLGMDTLHAYEFCQCVAQQTGGVVLPPTYWNANGHVGWPGSLLVRERTFRALVRDILRLLAEQDVQLVIVATGHWPSRQGATIAKLAREAMITIPNSPRILALDPFGCHPTDSNPGHAGKKETSLMLAIRPDLVHMHKLSEVENAFDGIGEDAVDASAEFGKEYFNASVQNCVRLVTKALDELADQEV